MINKEKNAHHRGVQEITRELKKECKIITNTDLFFKKINELVDKKEERREDALCQALMFITHLAWSLDLTQLAEAKNFEQKFQELMAKKRDKIANCQSCHLKKTEIELALAEIFEPENFSTETQSTRKKTYFYDLFPGIMSQLEEILSY
ncbi:TPA: hypothetical protein DCZ15_03305 [Candidatus Falkowbacteria bacterium]|nr:MAG: hypothetical protein UV95_C0002G0048 [Candidatus Falkowbacteria bacterium GW2011_GWF2_43_32]HBA36876.1 hypothetical protein [Candidatus Falkowbacteria bacterium]